MKKSNILFLSKTDCCSHICSSLPSGQSINLLHFLFAEMQVPSEQRNWLEGHVRGSPKIKKQKNKKKKKKNNKDYF